MALKEINSRYFKIIHSDVVEKENKISVKCDICGDSKKDAKKKRLELYNKGGDDFIKCFNCGFTGNMWSYLKLYHPEYYTCYQSERQREYINNINILKNDTIVEIDCGLGDELPSTVIKNYKELYKGLEPVITGRFAEYIENRKVPLDNFFFSPNNDIVTPTNFFGYKNMIVYPFKNWTGFYSRSIVERKFKTYIYKGNKYIINITDLDNPIYVFEGIFDYLSTEGIDNYIILCGADFPKNDSNITDILNFTKNLIFCYDNDETGIKKKMEMLQKGYKVLFLPKEYNKFKDLNEILVKNPLKRKNITEIINTYTISGVSGIIKLKTRFV